MNRRWMAGLGAVAVLAGMASPLFADRAALAMLGELDRGNWELRTRGDSAGVEHVCLGDARSLIQLRHPSAVCDQLVVSDSDGQVTVQYTCKGHGYGRTHIRRESNQLIQIDSQGIANGLPFSFVAEGRRIGSCRS